MTADLKVTGDPVPIRSDIVEAMKRKRAAGEVGNDSARLADRIIDGLLKG
jgi:hypothetical protein